MNKEYPRVFQRQNPVYISIPVMVPQLKSMVRLIGLKSWNKADGLVLIGESLMDQIEVIRFSHADGKVIADRWPPNDHVNDLVMNTDSMELLYLYADENGYKVCPFVYPHNLAKIEKAYDEQY